MIYKKILCFKGIYTGFTTKILLFMPGFPKRKERKRGFINRIQSFFTKTQRLSERKRLS